MSIYPPFETLLSSYQVAKDNFLEEIRVAEHSFDIANSSNSDILVDREKLQSLYDTFVQCWKELILTEEFFDMETCDKLEESFNAVERRSESLCSKLKNYTPSPEHVKVADPCLTPPATSDSVPSPSRSPCFTPPPEKVLSPSQSPCLTPRSHDTATCPMLSHMSYIHDTKSESNPAPCLTPSPEKYVPPHRRSSPIDPYLQQRPDVMIDMSPPFISTPHTIHKTNYARGEQICKLCPENTRHRLWNCRKFLDMRPYDRLLYVIDHALCHNCLLPTHETAFCGKKSVCSVPGCGLKHSKYIHVSGANSDFYTTSFSLDKPSVFDPVDVHNVLPVSSYLHSHVPVQRGESDHLGHLACDEKLNELQSMLSEMNNILTCVIKKFQKLESFVDNIYPGHNDSIFRSGNHVPLGRLNLLQPDQCQSYDHNITGHVNPCVYDELVLDLPTTDLSYHDIQLLRASAVT